MSNQEPPQHVSNAYQAVISLWRLASEQIYSRFATMLTANSIVVAATILSVNNQWPKIVPMVLAIAGIILCAIWVLFNKLAIKTEKEYIEKARKIENYIPAEFRMVPYGYRGFDVLSRLTIVLFIVIYLSLLFFYVISNLTYFCQ